jgi:hypothetical protein
MVTMVNIGILGYGNEKNPNNPSTIFLFFVHLTRK